MFSLDQIKTFKKFCSLFNIDLSDDSIQKFRTYTDLLLEWNRRIHLVSKTDATIDRIIRHFVDSLSIFKAIHLKEGMNILDLGSGAGFPSIPIKIVRDDVHLTLVESVHKKTLFLKKLSEVLGLEKVTVINQRAEKLLEDDNFKNRFDLVTAKALGKLQDVIQLGMPFLKIYGFIVVFKGKGIEKEIQKINLPEEGKIIDTVKIEIPEIGLLRWIVIVER